MVICKGDGTLMIDLNAGDIKWVEVSSAMESWCRQNGYKNVLTLEGTFNLESHILELPACEECQDYKDCRQCLDSDLEELNSLYCTAVDEEATSQSILGALAALNEDEREEIVGS